MASAGRTLWATRVVLEGAIWTRRGALWKHESCTTAARVSSMPVAMITRVIIRRWMTGVRVTTGAPGSDAGAKPRNRAGFRTNIPVTGK